MYDSLNLPKQFIICGDLTHYVHIDYTFIPKKVSNSLDIIFYENMAILYACSDTQAQRTIRRGRCYWCCFTMTHDVNLTDKELIKLHDSNIVMKVYSSSYRVAEKLLRINPGIYSHESVEDINKLFAPVYKVNDIPHLTQNKSFAWNGSQNGTFDINEAPSLNEFQREAGQIHRSRAEYFINHLVQHSNLETFISRPPFGIKSQHMSISNLKDMVPRTTRERNSPAGTTETYLELIGSDFSFPGEMIFTDRKELLFDMNTNKNLRGFILITVNNLLTPEQCHQLNPFLISLLSIENVPVSILRENGFDRIYVQYETPLFGAVQTNTYPLSKHLSIQESRSFLTHSKDKLELLNFAQSGHIIFKVRGIRSRQPGYAGEGALFGTQDVHFKLNKPFTQSTKNLYRDLLKNNNKDDGTIEDRLLFVAQFTYNKRCLNLGWISTSSIACTTMENIFSAWNNKIDSIRKLDCLNVIGVHYTNGMLNEEEEECLIQSRTLMQDNTMLNLTTSIASSLSKILLSVLSTDEPLSRIGLLIYDINVILELLTMIYEHNNSLKKINNSDDDFSKQRSFSAPSFKLEKSYQNFLTGYYIDNGKTFYLFLEGSSTGFIQVMWSKIMHLSRNVALVWYNSDSVYTKRLYSNMLPSTSIYGIVLREPIETLFQQSYTFLKGSMPLSCWAAVRKLNFLFMESTMIYTSERGLFPTMEELISFDIEFGIPKKMADPYVNPSTSALFN